MNIMNLYVYENRSISNDLSKPIMLENLNVDTVRIHLPKEIDGTDMGTWAWWFVYQNAKKEKFSIPMILESATNDDEEEEYIAMVALDHGFTGRHGTVMYAVEALQADGSGAITGEWHTITYKINVLHTIQGNQIEYSGTQEDIISALLVRINELMAAGGEIADLADVIEGAAEAAQEVIDSIPQDYSALSSDVDDLKANLEDLDDRVEALESGGGSGLTESIKTALMNVVNHIAWDDDDPSGQSYITALYNALYPPAPPASLTSITAVYTQSGIVYDTDTLNDLKSDLVVTAHYSDSTSHAVTDYTLSGTLAVGTSVIAANYNGKSTTFSVTVISGHLHPLENGSHTFTTNNRVLTVTRGSHFVYEAPNSTSSGNPKGAYLNLSTVSDNDTSATTADNVLVNDPLFTIPANAQVVFEVKNISFTNLGVAASNNKYAFNMRNGATSLGMSSGDKGISDTDDISFTKTFDVDTPVTCIFAYISNQFSRFEADISLTVNNVRWI